MDLAKVPAALRPPFVLAHKARRRLYAWRHPGEPWMEPGVIRFCARALQPGWVGLEWGSGRSTAWFARRLAHLTSVEHDEAWHAIVAETLRAQSTVNVDYRFVALDHDLRVEPQLARYEVPPRYVAVAGDFADASLDFVVVDGAYREACVLAAVPKLKPGGLLLLDDSRWFPRAHGELVPAAWPIVYRSDTMISQTTVWQRPT